MADSFPAVMTPTQFANWYGVSTRVLEDWRAAKVGPPFTKVRQTVRYRRSAVEEWMATQESRGARRSARIGLAPNAGVRVSMVGRT